MRTTHPSRRDELRPGGHRTRSPRIVGRFPARQTSPDHTDRHANERNPDHRDAGKQDTGLGAVADHARDRSLKEDRGSKIPTRDVRQPAKILNDDRLIEPEFRPQGIDLIRCRRVAEQHVERITGNKMHEEEDEFEYEDMELLERLETLREDMEDLKVTTLSELIQRIEELHRKLDNEQ